MESHIQNLCECEKYYQVKKQPYGIWKQLIEYINLDIELINVKKNTEHGKMVMNMRNENRFHCFNNVKYTWENFQHIFFHKYFNNDIEPVFVVYKYTVLGFIGCKTLDNWQDIGIMFFKKYQNMGFGSIALQLFFIKFQNYNYQARIVLNNYRSVNLFRKLGFQEKNRYDNVLTFTRNYSDEKICSHNDSSSILSAF